MEEIKLKKILLRIALAATAVTLSACGGNDAKFTLTTHKEATTTYPVSKRYTMKPSDEDVTIRLDGKAASFEKINKKSNDDLYIPMKSKTQKMTITRKYDSDTYTKHVTVPKLTKSQATENQKLLAKKAAKVQKAKKNFTEFKLELKTIPAGTKGAITEAHYDSSTDQAVLVLSDDAMSFSNNELKMVSKSAWNLGNKMVNNYQPMPEDAVSGGIVIQDSAGDQIAHSSMFGNFKYDYDK